MECDVSIPDRVDFEAVDTLTAKVADLARRRGVTIEALLLEATNRGLQRMFQEDARAGGDGGRDA